MGIQTAEPKPSRAQGILAQAARNNREKEKALRQKTKPVGACEAVQKAARAGGNLEEKSRRRRGGFSARIRPTLSGEVVLCQYTSLVMEYGSRPPRRVAERVGCAYQNNLLTFLYYIRLWLLPFGTKRGYM